MTIRVKKKGRKKCNVIYFNANVFPLTLICKWTGETEKWKWRQVRAERGKWYWFAFTSKIGFKACHVFSSDYTGPPPRKFPKETQKSFKIDWFSLIAKETEQKCSWQVILKNWNHLNWNRTKHAHDVVTTSYWRRCDDVSMTTFRRHVSERHDLNEMWRPSSDCVISPTSPCSKSNLF